MNLCFIILEITIVFTIISSYNAFETPESSNLRHSSEKKETYHRRLLSDNLQCLLDYGICEVESYRMNHKFEDSLEKIMSNEDNISDHMKEYMKLTDGVSGEGLVGDLFNEVQTWAADLSAEESRELSETFRDMANNVEYIKDEMKEENNNDDRRRLGVTIANNEFVEAVVVQVEQQQQQSSVVQQKRELQNKAEIFGAIELLINGIIGAFYLIGQVIIVYFEIMSAIFYVLFESSDDAVNLMSNSLILMSDVLSGIANIFGGDTQSKCREERLGCRLNNVLKATYIRYSY